MLKIWLSIICSVPMLLLAVESNPSQKNDLKVIEKQIDELKAKLAQLRFDEMNQETSDQKYMIADWEKYAKDTELIRQKDLLEQRLTKQIQELEKRKAELIKSPYDQQQPKRH